MERILKDVSSVVQTQKKKGQISRFVPFSSESWTRTSDLRVMSPTSYLLLYLAILTVQIYNLFSFLANFWLISLFHTTNTLSYFSLFIPKLVILHAYFVSNRNKSFF